jgi:hypothetical protein
LVGGCAGDDERVGLSQHDARVVDRLKWFCAGWLARWFAARSFVSKVVDS